MKKPTIVVDIDDVMAAEAGFIIDYSNAHWGSKLTLEDYNEHWQEVWDVDIAEADKRAEELHQPGIEGSYEPISGARQVLDKLSAHYRLIVVTSRPQRVKEETLQWLHEHFGNSFEDVQFTGFYDERKEGSHLLTKGDIVKNLRADYLMDDQLKHCNAAAEKGIKTVLFGDYPWNRAETLHPNITRCEDWEAVEKYFGGSGV